MSHLLTRILLALLMLPLAAVVYAFAVVAGIEVLFGYSGEIEVFLFATAVSAAFVAVYWILLWRSTVQWTGNRLALTVGAAIAALVAGIVVGSLAGATLSETSFGVFIGGAAMILLWLMFSVIVWRETGEERAARIRRRAPDALICPRCGYNMTGLQQSSCPECGATYTLNELMALQPSRRGAEIDEDDPV